MNKKTALLSVVVFSLIASVSCSPSAWPKHISLYSVINIARIETTLNEDGKGHNNFWLVVPAQSSCPVMDLMPAFAEITKPTSPSVFPVGDKNFRGYKVIYDFENTDQIPVQIENIKRTVVNAAIAAQATPTPVSSPMPGTPTPIAVPPVPIGLYYNPNFLSINFSAPSEELTGQKWKLQVIVNPFLMTGLITEEFLTQGLQESCSIPTFTYQLNVSSKMKINDFTVETLPHLISFSNVRRISDNSIEWTIESKPAFDVLVQGIVSGMTPAPQPTEAWQSIEYLYTGQIYTLNVNATTPNPWFTFLTIVVAPLLGLLAVSLGLFVTIKNLRRKEKP